MNCNSSPFSFSSQMFFSNDCFSCQDNNCGANVQKADCVIYLGPNLSCSGIMTNDSLTVALQKIDSQICSAIGDYSNYQFNCLIAYWGSPITQESVFVDAITNYACFINNKVDTFIGATFADYQTAVNTRFVALEVPGITCASTGTAPTDTLQTVLTSYCTKFESIDTALDLSSVVWNNCFTVPSTPTTIADGFITVLSQICQIASTSPVLPTFNNIGTCLASPGATDSLVDTVTKIRTRLCLTPTLDNTSLTSSCVSIPAGQTDLQTLLQSILNKIDIFTENAPSYSGDFVINPNGGPCDGITVSLATPINQDRFVASTGSDASPGTLQSKVTPGTGITLDFITTPGQMIINATSSEDHKVLADSSDDTPDYLDNKVEGASSGGVTITTSYDSGDKKVKFSPSVDMATIVTSFINYVAGNSESLSALCNLIAPCIGVTCVSYSIANATGSTVNVTYVDCVSNTPIATTVSDGSTIVVCAKYGTVTAVGCTITSLGACTSGGGGGGGITVRVTNTLGGTTINEIGGISGFTLSSPVGVGGIATGIHNSFAGTIHAIITGTPVFAGNVTLSVNGITAACQVVNAAGDYPLNAGPYLSTDVLEIFLNSGGTC